MSYEHHITNAVTGETTVVPFTPEEIAVAEAQWRVKKSEVKAEAARRIAETGVGWMVEREVSGGAPIPQAVKDACALIRERSNAIEMLDPIPYDLTDDKYWR